MQDKLHYIMLLDVHTTQDKMEAEIGTFTTSKAIRAVICVDTGKKVYERENPPVRS